MLTSSRYIVISPLEVDNDSMGWSPWLQAMFTTSPATPTTRLLSLLLTPLARRLTSFVPLIAQLGGVLKKESPAAPPPELDLYGNRRNLSMFLTATSRLRRGRWLGQATFEIWYFVFQEGGGCLLKGGGMP
jgi:hypothetical protein